MPFATKGLARDAIMALFVTAWNAQTPPIPLLLFDDKIQDNPKDNASWAKIQIKHTVGQQATLSDAIGQKRFTHVGIVTVQIFTEKGNGLVLNDRYAQVAKDAFQGKRTSPEGVWFTNVRSNEIGPDGNWYQTNVLADFQYDSLK